MTFVNAAMLLGLLGAAIPVVIHLLGRREPPRVEFPAVRFLMTRLTVQRRRLNIQRWALLALRMALIALVVLALAQPRIVGKFGAAWVSIGGLTLVALIVIAMGWIAWRGGRRATAIALGVTAACLLLGGGGWAMRVLGAPIGPVRAAPAEAAVALVLDNSIRLLFRDGDEARFDSVLEHARWLLDEFPSSSRFAIFDRTNRPTTFSLDTEAARRTVDGTQPVSVEEPLDRRIEAAIRLLRTSEMQHHTVYVITDLTAIGWDPTSAEGLQELLQEEPKVTLQIIDVGASTNENWRIERPLLPPQPLAAGVPGQVSVDVIAPDGMPDVEAQIELLMYRNDPQLPMVKAGLVELPQLSVVDRQMARAGEGGSMLLNLPPLDSGTYRGWVRLDVGDGLAIDNQTPWLVEVAPAPNILIVGGDAQERRVMASVLVDPENPIKEYEVTTIAPEGLANLDLTKFQAAIWLDPPDLRGPLAAWAQRGGKVFVSLGPNWKQEVPGELPFKTLRQWRVPDPGTYLDPVQPDHPALLNLSGSAVTWPQYPVRLYWQLELSEGVPCPLRMAGTGDPALIDLPWGRGRLLLVSTPIPGSFDVSKAWNRLLSGGDAWPTWLLMRQIMDQLARPDVGSLNVIVGSPVHLPQRPEHPERYQLFSPNQQVATVEPAESAIVPGPPLEPGHYWLRGGPGARGYTAHLRPGQTDMRRLASATLDLWLGKDQYSIATSRDEVKWVEGAGSGSQPLYAQAMVGAVLIWLLEHILANRFYKRKPS